MAKMNTQLPISKETLLRMLICAGGVLLFFFALVFPTFQQSSDLDRSIAERKVEIERQTALYPVYAQLEAELKKDHASELKTPDIQKLGQDELQEVIESIASSGADNGLKAITVNPDPKSLEDGKGLLLVNCRFVGPFASFRDFLLSLGRIPYVQYIETINAKETYEGVEMQMDLWLAMKKNVES